METPDFYPNTPDETHCLQASIKMALGAIDPNLKLGLAELLFLSGNSGEDNSWPLRIAHVLADAGFKVEIFDAFDLEDFAKDPENALRRTYGPEVAEAQISGSDVLTASRDAKRLLSDGKAALNFSIPDIDDIIDCLARGLLAICNVNSRVLNGERGYAGHFVLIYGYNADRGTLMIHNPGPPANMEIAISYGDFSRAWSYSGEIYKNILAIGASDNPEASRSLLHRRLELYKDFVRRSI